MNIIMLMLYVTLLIFVSLSSANDWPTNTLLVPGNEVIFSLETTSDYLTEFNKSNNEDNRFGFRCLCVGYEDSVVTSQRQGLVAMEMELVYAGAACATGLLSPDLEIPPLAYTTMVDMQIHAMIRGSPMAMDGEITEDGSEALLISRGLELSSVPTVHQVLDGQPLLRCGSIERQFLTDFVAGAESTAGGRLARWLAPTSRVEPSNCEIKAPAQTVRPSEMLSLPIVIRDQYGDNVFSRALKVDVVVQPVDSGPRLNVSKTGKGSSYAVPDVPYHVTVKENMCFHAISMMKAYYNYSFEELRLASDSWGDGGAIGGSFARIPAERLPVQAQPDGSYVATWTPRFSGSFEFRCTLDDYPVAQELIVEVAECVSDAPIEQGTQAECTPPVTPPPKLRRFMARHSAGLRIRASPSLQAEEIGRVPPGSNIGFVEEVVNKDGTWVRLGQESVKAFTDGTAEVAWCVQHHQHFDRALLVPVEPSTPSPLLPEANPIWPGPENVQSDENTWDQEDDEDEELTDVTCELSAPGGSRGEAFPDLRVFIPYVRPEPSKRCRLLRNEALAASPPARIGQRRSNGNSDEWGSPMKYRCTENIGDVNAVKETEIESEPSNSEPPSRELAQTGTQTSPDPSDDSVQAGSSKDAGRSSPRSMARESLASRSRAYKRAGSPPPVPSRAAPAPPVPKKQALSPSQAETLRAVFAALLWHEGIVHDAIACSAFLKFHPQLPKQGARVITRQQNDAASNKLQRHSVEVSNTAGTFLHLHPCTLELLSRVGIRVSSSRVRLAEIDTPIREEEPQAGTSTTDTVPGSSQSVVNVLPPALRALVALWDALYDANQLTAATDKLRQEGENNENKGRPKSVALQKIDSKTDRIVRCELCGGVGYPAPIVAHMRQAHPGCNGHTSKGYDRDGAYVFVGPPAEGCGPPEQQCGNLAQTYDLWYMYCEKCRDKIVKATWSLRRQLRAKCMQEMTRQQRDERILSLDHNTIKDNALFLLDLAPLTKPEPLNLASWPENTSRSPPTPPGSIWQPAPPFQCLPALGAAPKTSTAADAARYHSLGRPPPPAIAPVVNTFNDQPGCSHWGAPRVQRSVSMGQTSGNDLANAAGPSSRPRNVIEQDSLTGAGSSLLSQPSASLRRLIGCRDRSANTSVSAFEKPSVDVEALMNSPVMSFILCKRDLHGHRQTMDATVRINTVRQYAFEALNWLLRSATQPTCVHDVMWWFCNALDNFARMTPPPLFTDNKENVVNENVRISFPTPSTSTICPGGRSARGSRAAFHSFLGSVSALAPSLPPASAAGLQAIRCWSLHYSPHDRAFLHRSQVFSVISKILSHSEDGVCEDGMVGALHESFHSYFNKENYIWNCPDVTGWCNLTVSSRQGMAGALTDGSTETFWESGDEDRNKAKWIQMLYPGGTPNDRPHIFCLHIDNTRDTANKTLLVSFLYSGGSSEMFNMHDVEVDPNAATWVCFTLPRSSSTSLRVRCELRGPEPAVRVRQVRILGTPSPSATAAATPAQILHSLSEIDTLRVFRLLTSQVFGKLLQYHDYVGSDSGDGAAAPEDDATVGESDLREHVVGILFAGHKLTSLQKRVMAHIVEAINDEASRMRDDWDTALINACICYDTDEEPVKASQHLQDNYCFEMLSLLLALSGSAVGRAHLAQRTELIFDLLVLFHIGSERVQRQIISLIRRMIMELPPEKMYAIVNAHDDSLGEKRATIIDHLMAYLAKALTIQVKVKGGGTLTPSTVTMPEAVRFPQFWFMSGEGSKKHAHLVSKLLTDMAEDKLSPEWGVETREALANYILQLSQVPEEGREPNFMQYSSMWMALATLCVCQQSLVDMINGSNEDHNTKKGGETRPHCSNHDDGATIAMVECKTCGPLCAECDRFLHLNRTAKTHLRQVCKEEESAIRVDIHEGCGRVKLFWLLLLIDRKTLKGLAEFRGMDNIIDGVDSIIGFGPPGLSGTCRFCGTRSATGLLAIGNVCVDQQCQDYSKDACNRLQPCGHICGGVRLERTCLPCLHGCAGASGAADAAPLRQDADDMCMICFTDPLQAAPAIQLKCGHVFHLHCCKKVLASKWIGPRITFSFSQCPICKEDMDHWTLEDLLDPIRCLQEEVKRKALMRLEYEGHATPEGSKSKSIPDPATYAMDRYAYYVCHKCTRAYFGGLARCEAESNGKWEPAELVCGGCSDVARARTCPKHGADFLEYKCRYCCSVAVFFCFGTSHFCNSCHDDFQRVTNIPKHMLPQCPAGPKGEQLPGSSDECPLRVQHPATGEEFALGCGVCRHAQAF